MKVSKSFISQTLGNCFYFLPCIYQFGKDFFFALLRGASLKHTQARTREQREEGRSIAAYIQRRQKQLSVHRRIFFRNQRQNAVTVKSKPDVQPDHRCAFTLPRFRCCSVNQRATCLSPVSRVSRVQSDDGPIPGSAAQVTLRAPVALIPRAFFVIVVNCAM